MPSSRPTTPLPLRLPGPSQRSIKNASNHVSRINDSGYSDPTDRWSSTPLNFFGQGSCRLRLSVYCTFQLPFPLTQRGQSWRGSRSPRTKVSAAHDRLAPAKLVREFGPERSKGGVGRGGAAFGSHLNRVGAGGVRLPSGSPTCPHMRNETARHPPPHHDFRPKARLRRSAFLRRVSRGGRARAARMYPFPPTQRRRRCPREYSSALTTLVRAPEPRRRQCFREYRRSNSGRGSKRHDPRSLIRF